MNWVTTEIPKMCTWVLKFGKGVIALLSRKLEKQVRKMKIKPLLFVLIAAVSSPLLRGQVQPTVVTHNAAAETQNAPAVRFQTLRPGKKLQPVAVDQPQIVVVSTPTFSSASQPELRAAVLEIMSKASLNRPSGAPDNGRLAQDGNLPEAASALPLLSVIGAGVLIGGLFSARQTRRAK